MKNEAIVFDWQQEISETLAIILQLSESIAQSTQTTKECDESLIAQWVMQRGEAIQHLMSILTPERVTQLSPEASKSIQDELAAIQNVDKTVTQTFQNSIASIHQRLLGLQIGKTTLRGYHLNNESTYTRSNDV